MVEARGESRVHAQHDGDVPTAFPGGLSHPLAQVARPSPTITRSKTRAYGVALSALFNFLLNILFSFAPFFKYSG